MELSEDQIIQKHAKKCGYNGQNLFFPNEYENSCISCNCNMIKRKNELSEISRRKSKHHESTKICGKIFLLLYRCI